MLKFGLLYSNIWNLSQDYDLNQAVDIGVTFIIISYILVETNETINYENFIKNMHSNKKFVSRL